MQISGVARNYVYGGGGRPEPSISPSLPSPFLSFPPLPSPPLSTPPSPSLEVGPLIKSS